MPRPDTDWLLSLMLDGVSLSGKELPLTVFCGGLAVSGTVVPEEVFFRKFGLDTLAANASQGPDERTQEIARINAELERDDIPAEERRSLLAEIDGLERHFIAMIDVTILGAGPNPIRVPAWRGRLSQISGWTLGALNSSN